MYELWRDDALAIDAEAHAAVNCQENGKPITHRSVMRGPDADAWKEASATELRKLFRETKSMKPTLRRLQPKDRWHDTGRYNPQVKEKILADGTRQRRVRGTVSGDIIKYAGFTSTNTAASADLRILYNDVVSTDGAAFMSVDISDFYLSHDIDRPEFMWILRKDIPDSIMEEFDLHRYLDGDRILLEILKGMYGLKQAGRIANDNLVPLLEKSGFMQAPLSPGIFRHIDNGVTFALVVDDFGIKYTDSAGPKIAHQCARGGRL